MTSSVAVPRSPSWSQRGDVLPKVLLAAPGRVESDDVRQASEPTRLQFLGELGDDVEAARLGRLCQRSREGQIDRVLSTLWERGIAPRLPHDGSITPDFGSTRIAVPSEILALSRILVVGRSLRNQVCPRGYQGFESPSLRQPFQQVTGHMVRRPRGGAPRNQVRRAHFCVRAVGRGLLSSCGAGLAIILIGPEGPVRQRPRGVTACPYAAHAMLRLLGRSELA